MRGSAQIKRPPETRLFRTSSRFYIPQFGSSYPTSRMATVTPIPPFVCMRCDPSSSSFQVPKVDCFKDHEGIWWRWERWKCKAGHKNERWVKLEWD